MVGLNGVLPSSFSTRRLHVRRPELEDAEELFSIIELNRQSWKNILSWVDAVQTVQDKRDFIIETKTHWGTNDDSIFILALQDSKQIMGSVGVYEKNWEHRRCEVRYWVDPTFEGRGFISEALGPLTEILFTLGYNRVEIRCDADNMKSRRVALRCGFVQEGNLRAHFIQDKRVKNTIVYAAINPKLTS